MQQESFMQFLQSPNRENFLAIRERIVESDVYDPYSAELMHAHTLIDQGRWQEARTLLTEAMPNLLLSPRAHSMLCFVVRELGDAQGADAHRMIAAACCEGIASTGNGTRDAPYLVLRTTDEYDIVQYFEKSVASQALIQEGDRTFDLIECEDGTTFWFDVTDPFERAGPA
ncbi:MAG: DUF4919 domain-containing protein [Planctomycetales bacterium]